MTNTLVPPPPEGLSPDDSIRFADLSESIGGVLQSMGEVSDYLERLVHAVRRHVDGCDEVGVTILAILAGIQAVLAVLHLLQALGILPYVLGPVSVRDFNLWYVIMWGLMVWVWIWVFRMLWRVDRSGWMFLVIITIFNLMLNFFAILGAST